MKQKNWKDSFLSVFGYAIISIFAIICVIPLVMVISCSFTDEITLMQKGYNLFPEKFSLEAYKYIFGGDSVLNGYKVTLFVTIVGTSLSLLITSAVSYALSVKKLKYRNCITFLIFFTMLFNGGLVPSYYLISRILNMRDSVWVMIIPCLVNPFFVFLLRNFFKTIPGALAESAKIDGANDITILFKIVMPISLPAMATIGLFYALDCYYSQPLRNLIAKFY